jgi:large subunit ribosomal protein L10
VSSNLEAKRVIVEEIKEKLQASKGVVFVDYKGINVEQDTALRKSCREKNVTYKVYKNRLFVKALEELNITGYDAKYLEGTTAVAFSEDEVTAASVVGKEARDNKTITLKFGIINGEVVDAAQVDALSRIPSKDVLIAMLMGMLKAPVSALARALNEIAKK